MGCMESKDKRELIRIVAVEGVATIDKSGKANGRGIYLCRDVACFEKAKKRRAISRNLQIEVKEEEINKLFEELKEYENKNS